MDSLGLALDIQLTAGQVHDSLQAPLLVDPVCEYFVADKAYDSDDFRELLKNHGIEPVIPGKKNRTTPIVYDKHIYKERNLVERFFNKIKHFRRVATRYDKTALMFKTGVLLASIVLWLRV